MDTRSGAFGHLGQLNRCIVGELTLGKQRGQLALPQRPALHRFPFRGVHRREGNVKADVGQVSVRKAVPAADVTGFFGQLGNAVRG